jgi:DNA-binding NarL/FixJ family response regulator
VIRVLIVDDHAVVRAGLERLLANADDMTVVGAATDGAEAVSLAAGLVPDVVVMDLAMPRMDGIAATRALATAVPDARIVVLTSYSDRHRILAAVDAGAAGYLLKDADPAELLTGIRAAARGEALLAPKAAAVILGLGERRAAKELSERELEVLGLVATGCMNKQIAFRLGISEKTVKAHLTRIFRQIGVDDRMQAALWARRHGLVED